jgi:HTH-type transcriptional regulator/antitoxin HipB
LRTTVGLTEGAVHVELTGGAARALAGGGGDLAEADEMPPGDEHEPFPTGRYLVRGRRRADLSQRDLARLSRVPQSRIAALESGRGTASVERVDELLGAMGLRLAVVDAQGRVVEPAHPDLVRDNAGRRFPAHLDVDPPDLVPTHVLHFPRYDRLPARGWYHHRPKRDERRRRGIPSPPRHPTEQELRDRAARLRRGQVPRLSLPAPEPECTCSIQCLLSPGCQHGCPCQCEPAPPVPWPRPA